MKPVGQMTMPVEQMEEVETKERRKTEIRVRKDSAEGEKRRNTENKMEGEDKVKLDVGLKVPNFFTQPAQNIA